MHQAMACPTGAVFCVLEVPLTEADTEIVLSQSSHPVLPTWSVLFPELADASTFQHLGNKIPNTPFLKVSIPRKL